MEINDALVTAITRELIRRMGSGEVAFSENDVKKVLADINGSKPACCCTTQNKKYRKVISETEMQMLCPASGGIGQSVTIGTGDIVTPLAQDYIAKMRITVNRV
jgi:hypothetical protein